MSRTLRAISIIILILILLIGLACICYPAFSSWYNEKHKAQVLNEYQAVLDQTEDRTVDAAREAAIEYNNKLFEGELPLFDPVGNGYYEQINIAGNGIMGYIRIPTINVHLAIYHGVGDKALSTGAGHMPETSLPVGGLNTHSVLSAHSGMASNVLFSELERLQVGDYFYIDILGETLTYQILSQNDIISVLPSEIDHLRIIPEKDLVTLITCVPYSVNTHRLLVRGTRVETPNIEIIENTSTDTNGILQNRMSIRTLNYIKGITIGFIFAMFLMLTILSLRLILIIRKRKTKKQKNDDSSNTTPTTETGGNSP